MLIHLKLISTSNQTSTRETNDAVIIAKASPASNVGAPHWKGYGTLILYKSVNKTNEDQYATKNEIHGVEFLINVNKKATNIIK